MIVITGGASGLGRCMAEIWALKGATVAVLDIKHGGGEAVVEGANYYQCDISDERAVEKCWAQITDEVRTILLTGQERGMWTTTDSL